MQHHEIVIVLHGYMRQRGDVRVLANYLRKEGYGNVIRPNLPTTTASLEECTDKLREDILNYRISDFDKCHFVGHSMGGLVIRDYLSKFTVHNIGNVVLISTPNNGSDLATKALKRCPWIKDYSPSVLDMIPGREIGKPISKTRIGVIAGYTTSPTFFGRFIDSMSDGRVPTESMKFDGMDDYCSLEIRHTRIHKDSATCYLVGTFLKNGSFFHFPYQKQPLFMGKQETYH